MNATSFPVNYTVDARYNYWDSATGPYYRPTAGITNSNPNTEGTGNRVTDNITFNEWLHKSKADVVADSAAYWAETVKLSVGWNTLSTPVKLISSADAVDEIVDSDKMSAAYYYDSGLRQVTTGYVLSPGDAIYVKMTATDDVLLQYDAAAFSTPTRELHAGWNLVGLASLSNMRVDRALASVYKTAHNLPGYSLVVSPSMNSTSWAYSSGQNYTNQDMLVGEGYWIYMQNDSTLAGFTITPLVPDLSAVQPWSTAAQPPAPGIMHIGAIDMWCEAFPGNRYRVYTRVTIVDADGNAVSGATVSLETTLPDGSTTSDSGDTDANGAVIFHVTKKLTGTYTSTVTNVVGGNWIYDNSANEETSETLVVS